MEENKAFYIFSNFYFLILCAFLVYLIIHYFSIAIILIALPILYIIFEYIFQKTRFNRYKNICIAYDLIPADHDVKFKYCLGSKLNCIEELGPSHHPLLRPILLKIDELRGNKEEACKQLTSKDAQDRVIAKIALKRINWRKAKKLCQKKYQS